MYLILSLLLSLWPCITTAEEEPFEFPDEDLESRIEAVNEGELEFLHTPPAEPVHHHINRIQINVDSLDHGWVELHQCHRHLDPVPHLEIVYHPQRIRQIELVRVENIGSSRVIGSSIELRDIRHGATVCLRAETQSLHKLAKGGYQLRNGPYMRRFLDGYFPMQLSLHVDYPAKLIRFTGMRPLPVDTEHTRIREGSLYWSGWFQGKLFTELDFLAHEQDH
ncbi:hypothetical protein [Candidatus Thiodiazotropha sp. CDECU1]|uniref:hypothetical protein n=1 Tax=Candidatus Thiodiazotropha sp. CDECU1 TaxID=3065865 RepID=UPI0029302262|nr:hypothetical protein [Candidatus Thiodiazotropha sp. CDECU1]